MESGYSHVLAHLATAGFGARTKVQTPCPRNSKELSACVTSGSDHRASPTQRVAMLTIGCLARQKAFRSYSKVSSRLGLSLVQSWRLSPAIVLSCGAPLATRFFGHLTFVSFRSAVSPTSPGAFWSMKQPSPNPALNLAPFGRWTLRDRAAQRRLALRYNPQGRPKYAPPSNSPLNHFIYSSFRRR